MHIQDTETNTWIFLQYGEGCFFNVREPRLRVYSLYFKAAY